MQVLSWYRISCLCPLLKHWVASFLWSQSPRSIVGTSTLYLQSFYFWSCALPAFAQEWLWQVSMTHGLTPSTDYEKIFPWPVEYLIL
ncbi:Hypothetical predicted protein [Olea europaea subsp. europaea]|uniref:Uncharacterized protein n=1 Tax=Olea europaea subsp. europaea TaxID=158383 RepID=A0A8S0TKM5_OLEEU|nr:Hypothetical predicted protein [Olea europaea subsp. europaea]